MWKPRGRGRTALVLLTILCSAPRVPAQLALDPPLVGPIRDPIPEEPELSRWALELKEIAAFPKSDPDPFPADVRMQRHARINYLGELPDGSRRLYVPDLNGVLYFLVGGRQLPYLNVQERFEPDFFASVGFGSGFGFVSFHPEFAKNGKFYTVHTEAGAALTSKTPDLTPQPSTRFHGILTEWTASDPRADAFTGTSRELLRLGFATRIHGMQQVSFNPTAKPGDADYGLLYVAVGDGGIGDTSTIPQDLSLPHGKLLRIDPAGRNSQNGRYGIPASNPFVKDPRALGEICAYGLRDPHRFSWDAGGKHRLFLGHIGEHDVETLYDVLPGDNFGWSQREGRFVRDRTDGCFLYPLPADDAQYGYVYPLAEYDHNRAPELACGQDAGHALSGGFVYRGPVAALRGKYIFGDLVDGRVFYAEESELSRERARRAPLYELTLFESGKEQSMPQLAGDARVDLRFGSDLRNDLYLLAKANGKVWKVTGVRPIPRSDAVFPSLRPNLQVHYDFEHPAQGDRQRELDRGLSRTELSLVNGGKAMRVPGGAAGGSAVQLAQVAPESAGNDDWKAGVYDPSGVASLAAFNAVKGMTILTWVQMLDDMPALNSNTPDPEDRYNAIGLVGLLSGNSEGHAVRALLELISVGGDLRLAALGRRLDGGRSQAFAADQDWRSLLPRGEWVHLAGSFDFSTGTLRLYRNGQPIAGTYRAKDDPWQIAGSTDASSSPTLPRGIKIGGSFPQNTREMNPCPCRMGEVMLLDRVATQLEINQQYRRALGARGAAGKSDGALKPRSTGATQGPSAQVAP